MSRELTVSNMHDPASIFAPGAALRNIISGRMAFSTLRSWTGTISSGRDIVAIQEYQFRLSLDGAFILRGALQQKHRRYDIAIVRPLYLVSLQCSHHQIF